MPLVSAGDLFAGRSFCLHGFEPEKRILLSRIITDNNGTVSDTIQPDVLLIQIYIQFQ